MKTILTLLAVLFASHTTATFAHPLGCEPRGSDLIGGCRFPWFTMSTNLRWHDLPPFEASFSVTYDYSCEGHDVDIGIMSRDSFVKFERGGVHTARLDAFGKVEVVDRNREYTKNVALFKKDCYFKILSTSMEPSTRTIASLVERAKTQAKIIDLSIQIAQLGTSWERLSTWSTNELNQMKDEVKILRDVSVDSQDDLDKLVKVLDLALQGQPTAPDLGQVDHAIHSLQTFLLQKLAKEVDIGRALSAQFVGFSQEIDPDLAQAIAKSGSTFQNI